MPIGLFALSVGAFGIGLTEFVIMGLLPEVAADFAVTEATAGWLISGYALAVTVGALLLTAATTRLPRKPVLLGLLVLFIVGNTLSAVAPAYPVMLAGRILAALSHGAFFGIGSVVAAGLVTPERKARAVAIMFTGLTAANVLGVPFGTLLGQQLGWRSTFWAISAIGVVALAGLALLVPSADRARAVASANGSAPERAPSLRRELRAFASGQVQLSLVITVLAYGGMFGAFTYMAYTLTDVAGYESAAVPWLLVLSGLGLFVGNWIGGRLADRSIDGTLIAFIAGLLAVLVLFGLLASDRVAAAAGLLLMGGFGFGTVPGLQSRIMRYADGAPTLASGANIGAFNVGNALGAWAGGLAIDAGLGYTAPIWTGALITVPALALMISAAASAKRAASASASASASEDAAEARAAGSTPSTASVRLGATTA